MNQWVNFSNIIFVLWCSSANNVKLKTTTTTKSNVIQRGWDFTISSAGIKRNLCMFITPCFIKPCFITACFINPCFIYPCFITPCFMNACFIYTVHDLPIQSSQYFITCPLLKWIALHAGNTCSGNTYIYQAFLYLPTNITGGGGKSVTTHKINNLKIHLLRWKIGWVTPLYLLEHAIAFQELLIH